MSNIMCVIYLSKNNVLETQITFCKKQTIHH